MCAPCDPTVLHAVSKPTNSIIEKSVNKTQVLNDFAESVGVSKDVAFKNMVTAGIIKALDGKEEFSYRFTLDFYDQEKLDVFRETQINSSANPEDVDLTLKAFSAIRERLENGTYKRLSAAVAAAFGE